jgi:hypothetical protein
VAVARPGDVTVDGEVVVNEYFATHPEMILGELRRVNGQYGEHDMDVIADPGNDHEAAPAGGRAVERGLTYQPGPAPDTGQSPTAPAALSGQSARPASTAGPAVSSSVRRTPNDRRCARKAPL